MSIIYKKFNSKRRFGVEMEMNAKLDAKTLVKVIRECNVNVGYENWGYTINNASWVIKPDATCGDTGKKINGVGGYEAVSPPKYGTEHLQIISTIAQKLSDSGAMVNNFCGYHIHVEITDFDDYKAATVSAIWCKIEKILANMVPIHRVNAKYCKLLTQKHTFFNDKKQTPSEFWNIVKPKTLNPPGNRTALSFINYTRSKSNSYEWESFRNRITVELRLPEGTLNSDDIKNWARFFVNFIESNADRIFPENVSFVSLEEGLFWMGLSDATYPTILSPGLYETKLWVLNRILKFSRSIQLKIEAKKILTNMKLSKEERICETSLKEMI